MALSFCCSCSKYPVALAHHILALLHVCSVHIGQVINICGLTVSPAFKCVATMSARHSMNVGSQFGVAHRAIRSAPTLIFTSNLQCYYRNQTSLPISWAYSISSSCNVSMWSLTKAIGTSIRFFWPFFTKALIVFSVPGSSQGSGPTYTTKKNLFNEW